MFFFQRRLMPFAGKGFFAVFGQVLAPPVDRAVRDAQFTGHLGNGLAAGLSQPHRFFFEFFGVDLLDLSQDFSPF